MSTKKSTITARRVAVLAVFTAMSLIMFMIESLFPPLFLPGAKMGLSNIFSLLALIVLGWADAIIVVLVRTTLGSIFTGNTSTLIYSMSAGLVSIFVAILITKLLYPKITVIAVSVVSAVMHNLTQNVVFCAISNTPQMYVYMPWLAILGVVAGIIVGFAVYFVAKYVPLRTFVGISNKIFEQTDSTQLSVDSATDNEQANIVNFENNSQAMEANFVNNASEDNQSLKSNNEQSADIDYQDDTAQNEQHKE